MFILLTGLLVAIITFIVITVADGFEWINIFGSMLAGLLAVFLSFMISMVVGVNVADTENKQILNETHIELISLKDNNNYYLYKAIVNEELKYNFLYKTDKGITSDNIPAESTYINYTNQKPHLIIKEYCFSNPFLRFVAGNSFIPDEYYLYIPEGSVIEEQYQIDLE